MFYTNKLGVNQSDRSFDKLLAVTLLSSGAKQPYLPGLALEHQWPVRVIICRSMNNLWGSSRCLGSHVGSFD